MECATFDHGLLKAFPMLALLGWECSACKSMVENNGSMIVNGPHCGYVKCKCGHAFDPEVEANLRCERQYVR